MTNSLRLEGGKTQAPRSKIQGCVTGNSQTLHDLKSFARRVCHGLAV